MLAGRDDVKQRRLRRHHRRPRPVRRLQRRCPARCRGRDQGRRPAGPRLLGHRRRSQGRGLLPLPRLQDQGASSPASATHPSYDDAKEIGQHVIELFTSGEVDRVELVYTRFISAGSQEVVLRPLVPLERETVAGGDGRADRRRRRRPRPTSSSSPIPATILDTLLPRYIEARIYAALLNAAASEHAFRQRAMKSATDNAEELIKNLSRIMNRARQDSITTEIMEIVSGAEALRRRQGAGTSTSRSSTTVHPTASTALSAVRQRESTCHDHDRRPPVHEPESPTAASSASPAR